MPQIWLDDEELATLLRCPAAEARRQVLTLGWSRRRSRDGVSRTKLPRGVFEEFLLDYASRLLAEAVADRSVPELRGLLERAGDGVVPARRRAA